MTTKLTLSINEKEEQKESAIDQINKIMSKYEGKKNEHYCQKTQDVSDIDYFITSNTKDFKKQSPMLPVITPKQFMTLYKKKGHSP